MFCKLDKCIRITGRLERVFKGHWSFEEIPPYLVDDFAVLTLSHLSEESHEQFFGNGGIEITNVST